MSWVVCLMLSAYPLGGSMPMVCLGNGGATVGIGQGGNVIMCRWPSPGYASQIAGEKAGFRRGIHWGLKVDGKVAWLGDGPVSKQACPGYPGPRVVTESEVPGRDWRCEQTVFVLPERDVVVMRLRVWGEGVGDLVWYEDLSPCTRLVPELAMASGLMGDLDDFGVYADSGRAVLTHFRPSHPGSAIWARAEIDVAAGRLAEEADRYGDGMWMVVGVGEGEVSGVYCGHAGEGDSAAGLVEETGGAVGDVDGAVVLHPVRGEDGAWVATVYLSFGPSRDEALPELEDVLGRGYAGAEEEHGAWWKGRIEGLWRPADAEADVLAGRCLSVLLQGMDRETGAISWDLRTPGGALDWPRNALWITMALDRAGDVEAAERHTLFLAGAVREGVGKGKPPGSVASGYYPNGIEGVPHLALETDAASWVLASFWRHALSLEPGARPAYAGRVWGAAESAANFVAGWAGPFAGMPRPAFDWRVRRDRTSVDQILSSLAGLDGAIRLGTALGREIPGFWRERRSELDVLVRTRCVDANGRWTGGVMPPVGLGELEMLAGPVPGAGVDRDWSRVGAGLWGAAAAQAFCETAWVYRDQPDMLTAWRPWVPRLMAAAIFPPGTAEIAWPVAAPVPDACAAAQVYVGAGVVYGED